MPNRLSAPDLPVLQKKYESVRQRSVSLAASLSEADATVQSMEDASPAKWHLAHTSWFFETFILAANVKNYQRFDPAYDYLFNSYYEAVGARHPRSFRGLLTRPPQDEILAYRQYVDDAMSTFFGSVRRLEICRLVELGLHHEEQHQELLLTDILHLFAQNPIRPAYRNPVPLEVNCGRVEEITWHAFDGGVRAVGHGEGSFCFDCETPRHDVLLSPFEVADRAVTNGEWLAFLEDGGYANASLWLADGWDILRQESWVAPLYWEYTDGVWQNMTLRGLQPIDLAAPVSQVSFFEAAAYASWVEARLPTEYEWEIAAGSLEAGGNFAESELLRPRPQNGSGLRGFYGDVWEWTQSPFTPYPGYKVSAGAVGEYNGKFMNGQMVLKGGSCVTPAGHIRSTYRNFFHPQKRWQFSGLRLARDC